MSNILFNKVVTYRLQACNFVKKCLAKISLRKFPGILVRAILQNTRRKTSVVESFVMKFQG